MLAQYLFQFSPVMILVGVVGITLGLALREIHLNYRLRKLGSRPPVNRSWCPPLGLDLIYRAVKMARAHRDYESWKSRTDALGNTFEMTVVMKRVVFTIEPENIKAILATQFSDYGKGDEFHKNWTEFLGDSVFTTDGALWHASRQLIRPQFIKDRVSDLHIFEKHVQKMIALIPRNEAVVNMSDLIFRFTLDSATEFLLGESVDSLDCPQVAFAHAFAEIQRLQNEYERVRNLRHLMNKKTFREHLKVLNNFVQPFVEKAVLLSQEELKSKSSQDYNFLHSLAEFTTDKRMLRDQLVAVLIAGRDTTAGTLSWTLFELAKRPEIVRRLREEIITHLGPNTPPTYAHLKEMKFLQHVINETLRLYPAVPFNIRMALKDTTLPTGGGPTGRDPVAILKNTPVAYSALLMQRRKDLFGEDVDEYKPERWDTWSPKSWTYIPFNGGPRICVGQQFALTEMGYVLVRLFQAFEAVTIEQPEIEKQFSRIEITMSPGAGVKVRFRPATI